LMSDVTRILSQIDSGDPQAAAQLLPLVYEELRKLAAAKLAHEKPGQTLQATALVHEAYLRLVGAKEVGSRKPEVRGFTRFRDSDQVVRGSQPLLQRFLSRAAEVVELSVDPFAPAAVSPASQGEVWMRLRRDRSRGRIGHRRTSP
jgi:hypothetical protein